MICKNCATGADCISRAKEIDHPKFAETLRHVGKKLHAYCKGGTHCDCAHKERK